MRINTNTRQTGALAVLAVCAFLSGALRAQTVGGPDANHTNPSAKTASVADASAAKPHEDSFVIGNDDVLAINVWKEPDISRSIPVRSDGKISLPLVGEVQAAGLTPLNLEKDIAGRSPVFFIQLPYSLPGQQ